MDTSGTYRLQMKDTVAGGYHRRWYRIDATNYKCRSFRDSTCAVFVVALCLFVARPNSPQTNVTCGSHLNYFCPAALEIVLIKYVRALKLGQSELPAKDVDNCRDLILARALRRVCEIVLILKLNSKLV